MYSLLLEAIQIKSNQINCMIYLADDNTGQAINITSFNANSEQYMGFSHMDFLLVVVYKCNSPRFLYKHRYIVLTYNDITL